MTTILILIIYLSFISLGLPDSLLGSAWPSMYEQMGASITEAGTLAMIISACTILSSLMADRVIHKFGTGKVTMVSVATTAVAYVGSTFAPKVFGLISDHLSLTFYPVYLAAFLILMTVMTESNRV